MEDWKEYKLEDLLTIKYGKNQNPLNLQLVKFQFMEQVA